MTDQLAFMSPTRPNAGTQNAKVLAALEGGGTACGDFFLRIYIPRYAARILDLRQAGFDIRKVECPYPYHTHTKALASYELRTP